MVDGLWVLLRRISPSLDHFQDEEIEFVDEMGIDNLAFEIRTALVDKWRLH